jgi:amino acid transporter
MIAASRQIFAFSRDGALPFSRFLYCINSSTRTPVRCVGFGAFMAGLFGLLAFAGPAASGAIFSLGVVAQYLAYLVPISSRFLFKNDFIPGPFNLGVLVRPFSPLILIIG